MTIKAREFRAALDRSAYFKTLKNDRKVRSGIYSMWGSDLGWPAWIFEGTELPAGDAVPPLIGCSDDLIILANFLDHVGPDRLLKSISSRSRSFDQPFALARKQSAPNLFALLELEARALQINNDHLTIQIVLGSEYLNVSLAINSDLGLVGEFIEYAIVIYITRTAKMMEPPRILNVQEVGPDILVRGRHPTWCRIIERAEECKVRDEAKNCTLRIPNDWIAAENPAHDDDIWSDATEWIAALEQIHRPGISAARLEAIILTVLLSEHRLPRFNEIADLEGVSERTLARKLSEIDSTYQSLIDRVRSDLAERLMKNEDRSIEQVARELGFSHGSSFARAFRQWFACTPTEWRNRY